MDEKMYKKYMKRIAQIGPKVDNAAPRFDVKTYYKTRNLLIDYNRVRELDRENMKLLKRLNILTRLGGSIDCWLPETIHYVSTVDAPRLANKKIMRENKKLLQRILNVNTNYSAAEFIQSWKEMKEKTKHGRKFQAEPASHIIGLKSHQDHCMITDLSLLKDMNPSIRTKCFFDIEVLGDKQKLGRIQFELYDDVVPQTCANFAELCRGNNGLSYKNTPFHRIVSGYWCQGGDVTKYNGSGGTSIYGESFQNENYHLRHAGPGILSMCNDDEEKSNSKFNLTFRQLKTVDGKHVVFGKVIKGLSNIYKLEEFGTKTGKPFKTVVITNCGVISRTVDD